MLLVTVKPVETLGKMDPAVGEMPSLETAGQFMQSSAKGIA